LVRFDIASKEQVKGLEKAWRKLERYPGSSSKLTSREKLWWTGAAPETLITDVHWSEITPLQSTFSDLTRDGSILRRAATASYQL